MTEREAIHRLARALTPPQRAYLRSVRRRARRSTATDGNVVRALVRRGLVVRRELSRVVYIESTLLGYEVSEVLKR